ncbi:MAG: hypothetical protein ACRDMI_17730 [Streptosporangiaceae bacterium]
MSSPQRLYDPWARMFREVRAARLTQPGRGRALRAQWPTSSAEVAAHMDVDPSTDLNALLPLVAPLLSGHGDVAIGTRLSRGSRAIRGQRRQAESTAARARDVGPVPGNLRHPSGEGTLLTFASDD